MKKVSRTSKKGFTLVELLVVIGIIGLLAAIILPKFTGYTQKAIMKDAVSQARKVYTDVTAYYAEKGKYPVANAANNPDAINSILNNVGTYSAPAQNPADGNYLVYYDADGAANSGISKGDFDFYFVKGGKSYIVKYRGDKFTEVLPT